jgi:hypothetical protein
MVADSGKTDRLDNVVANRSIWYSVKGDIPYLAELVGHRESFVSILVRLMRGIETLNC